MAFENSLPNYLQLHRCPHCQIAKPNLSMIYKDIVAAGDGGWVFALQCGSCGLLTVVQASKFLTVVNTWPKPKTYSMDIPERARESLADAHDALATPRLSIIGSATAVDWMLKEKGYKTGNLHKRIEQAAADHLITPDMKDWAHEVRLEANNERHADDELPKPTLEDAQRVLKFAEALAELLFELPARVARGRRKTVPSEPAQPDPQAEELAKTVDAAIAALKPTR